MKDASVKGEGAKGEQAVRSAKEMERIARLAAMSSAANNKKKEKMEKEKAALEASEERCRILRKQLADSEKEKKDLRADRDQLLAKIEDMKAAADKATADKADADKAAADK